MTRTPKDNKENTTDIEENQKIKQEQIKSVENNRNQNIIIDNEQEKKQEKDKENKKESITKKKE